MISIVNLRTGSAVALSDLTPLLQSGGSVWVDLREPVPEEVKSIEQVLGAEMPTRFEMQEIETSSRIYSEEGAHFLTATLIANAEGTRPEAGPCTFVLTPKALVTIRFLDNTPFQSFAKMLPRRCGATFTPLQALTLLLDTIVDRLADILEKVGQDLDQISRYIFGENPPRTDAPGGANGEEESPPLKELMSKIGRGGMVDAKVRESLTTVHRLVRFVFTAVPEVERENLSSHYGALVRDVQSITDFAGFLNGKINFLLDAVLGLINIEQNQIIKIFSIVAVIFLPPTLIASVYGMNFKKGMPELEWEHGYAFAVGLMVLTVVGTLYYFRRKKWI